MNIFSSMIFAFSFIICAIFLFANFDSCHSIETFSAIPDFSSSTAASLIYTIPKVPKHHIRTSIFLDFTANNYPSPNFAIDSTVHCEQLYGNETVSHHKTFQGRAGSYKIFSTDFTSYEFLTVQVLISNTSLIQDANFQVIQSSPEFGKTIFIIRIFVSICCILVFLTSCFSFLLFSQNEQKYEIVISLCALMLAVFTNLPFPYFNNNFSSYFINCLLKGVFPEVIFAALLLFITISTDRYFVLFVVIVSFLQILYEAVSELSKGCLIFGNDSFIFGSVMSFFSVLYKISILIYLFYIITRPIYFRNIKENKLLQIYLFLMILELIIMFSKCVISLSTSYGNIAFDFFEQHLFPTIITLIFIEIHLPLLFKGRKSMNTMEIVGETEDIQLSIDDESSSENQDEQSNL
ncbi:hypothetical protein TRFO_22757 [Tritrichomonas foetus]|uniref:Intimal thickness related receptor IRP domain-containing protein n=1 Tax=Tritrichomonas foetus TaxID=1144522 RepID=A0A1J4KH48_9EUKA|nr:hypothetical protein TRFO_22757 [Tritrichomonas foetus]|eukprot:OHT08669.1 hypothetical protein TRFO_22757 [Tritrichomonas foetus]